jgi:hypothetical protein
VRELRRRLRRLWTLRVPKSCERRNGAPGAPALRGTMSALLCLSASSVS